MSDAELIRHVYLYEEHSGRFLWRNPPAKMARSRGDIGDEAGTTDVRRGNRLLRFNGKLHQASRLAWLYVMGDWPDGQVLYRDATLPLPLRDRFSNLKMAGKEDLSADGLRAILSYDPGTGIFTWRAARKGVAAGSVAGSVKNVHAGKGVAYIGIDGTNHAAPRLAWLYMTGEWPPARLRYIDGDGSNVRFDNLTVGEFEHGTRQTPTISEEERKAREKARYRRSDLKRRFGLTDAEFEAMHAGQEGRCAICKEPEIATRGGVVKRLAVDHSHSAGHVRELLCAQCNMALGLMQDEPARLRAAADYLERHAKEDVE